MPVCESGKDTGKTVVCKAAGRDPLNTGNRRRSMKDFQYFAFMALLMAQLVRYLER